MSALSWLRRLLGIPSPTAAWMAADVAGAVREGLERGALPSNLGANPPRPGDFLALPGSAWALRGPNDGPGYPNTAPTTPEETQTGEPNMTEPTNTEAHHVTVQVAQDWQSDPREFPGIRVQEGVAQAIHRALLEHYGHGDTVASLQAEADNLAASLLSTEAELAAQRTATHRAVADCRGEHLADLRRAWEYAANPPLTMLESAAPSMGTIQWDPPASADATVLASVRDVAMSALTALDGGTFREAWESMDTPALVAHLGEEAVAHRRAFDRCTDILETTRTRLRAVSAERAMFDMDAAGLRAELALAQADLTKARARTENLLASYPDRGVPPVVLELMAERVRQVAKGYTADHDDAHTPDDMVSFAGDRLDSGMAVTRKALVEAAAILVAAVESWDRKASGKSGSPGVAE